MTFEAKFEPRDIWVGLFWDRRIDGLHIYVCPVPLLVLHWTFPRDLSHVGAELHAKWAAEDGGTPS